MNKDKRKYARSWKVKRNQIRIASEWKQRWQTEPVFMRSNLDSLIRRNTDLGKRNRDMLIEMMQGAPRIIKTGELRDVIRKQWNEKGYSLTTEQVERKRVKLWRHRLLKFDHLTLAWTNFACID
jgi:hypothetical protein